MKRAKPASVPLVKEIVIEDYLVEQFERIGGTAEKFKTPGRRHVPDRLCSLKPGQLFFVECKRPGEKPRPGQLRDHARRRANGHKVYVVSMKWHVDQLVGTRGDSMLVPGANPKDFPCAS